jgi:hypothetical protein
MPERNQNREPEENLYPVPSGLGSFFLAIRTTILIYLKRQLGIWREEKTEKKFRRGAQVYRQISLLEIGRRVKCKISF